MTNSEICGMGNYILPIQKKYKKKKFAGQKPTNTEELPHSFCI
jgi:hypothetical protein